MPDYFLGQIYNTFFYIVFDIMAKRLLAVFPGYQFLYFLDFEITC